MVTDRDVAAAEIGDTDVARALREPGTRIGPAPPELEAWRLADQPVPQSPVAVVRCIIDRVALAHRVRLSPDATASANQPGDVSNTNPSLTSGLVRFEHWYDFIEGGPVHRALLPFPSAAPAPFEVARWSVAPGTSNDRDVHRSRELWIIVSGTGTLTCVDQTSVLRAGDVVAFESRVPHQIRNDGAEPLRAISVYWLQEHV